MLCYGLSKLGNDENIAVAVFSCLLLISTYLYIRIQHVQSQYKQTKWAQKGPSLQKFTVHDCV